MTRAYRHEWLLLVLIGLSALSFFHRVLVQDITRLALTQAVTLHGSLRIDRWHEATIDKAEFRGRYYSDKAPGMSFLAVPPFQLLRSTGVVNTGDEQAGIWNRRGLVWTIRAVTGGFGLLLAVFLVGRVSEGIAAGTGAATATAFGLGTLAFPLAATMFGHVVAGALGFAAFVAAWSGARARHGSTLRFAVAGLCAGLAVLVEYQAALIAAVLLIYVATRALRAALVFLAAALPSALALALYNLAAFESPVRFSYRYVTEEFAAEQAKGLFGIGVPPVADLARVLVSWDGLVVQSPMLMLAGAGIVLLWQSGIRAEAIVCGAITLLFLVLNAGYYDPIGGLSPGPRFFVPALPFLAIGLAGAFRRWPSLTMGMMAISFGFMIYRSATWAPPDEGSFTTILVPPRRSETRRRARGRSADARCAGSEHTTRARDVHARPTELIARHERPPSACTGRARWESAVP